MRNSFLNVIFYLFGLALISACAVSPVKQDIELPIQDLNQPLLDEKMVRLVMYNNSNKLWFGVDGSGEVNITLDGKGVCRLGNGEYVIVEIFPGDHTFDLEHRDFVLFKSSYTLSVNEKLTFMQVFATPVSNVAEITEKPELFEKKYAKVK